MYLWSIDSGSMKNLQTLSVECIDSAHLWLVVKFCTGLKKIVGFQEEKKMGFWRVYAQRQVVQNTVEEKLGAIACESGNVQVQRENIIKCLRYYKRLGWVNWEDSKKAMVRIGNDQ
jgi:hypothetical protein